MAQQPSFIFTRYLYVKEEVELALVVSILNKNDDSLFWAYELYYSGFKYDLFRLLKKIYYDFFATLNPSFETYLLKKEKELLNDPNNHIVIGSIVQTMLFRPFNTDVFLLRLTNSLFEYDINYPPNTEEGIKNSDDFRKAMSFWIETADYISLTQWILNINKEKHILDHLVIYECCLELFELTKGNTIGKTFGKLLDFDKNIVLLAKIMLLFSEKRQLKKSKSIYAHIDPETIITYESLYGSNGLPHYRVLEKACICGIDDLKHLGLFKLKRSKYNLTEKYLNNWLFYASYSPLWAQRIACYGGLIDYANENVCFSDDDLMEQFYELYGLEPDEQKSYVQQKSIGIIECNVNWSWFYNKYKNNGLFELAEEELTELNGNNGCEVFY